MRVCLTVKIYDRVLILNGVRGRNNAGAGDIATKVKDDENGRFEELGWARGFDTSGTVTRTCMWKVGEGASQIDMGSYGGSGGNRNDLDAGDERGGVGVERWNVLFSFYRVLRQSKPLF